MPSRYHRNRGLFFHLGLATLLGLVLSPGVGSAQLPEVSIAATSSVVAGNDITVTLTISTRTSPLFVNLTYSHDGTNVNDFAGNSLPSRARTDSQVLTHEFTISTKADSDTSNESFTIKLAPRSGPGASWQAGSPDSAIVTITPAGVSPPSTPTVSLAANPNPVDEGTSVTVTATLSAALSADVAIPVTLTDGTAEPADHGTLTSITISSGSLTGTGAITTNQDADQADETFTVALGSLPNSVRAGSPNSVEIRIVDDDRPAPTVNLAVSPIRVNEGSTALVTVSLARSLRSDVVIPLTLTNTSAESTDYTAPSSITISTGATSGTGSIRTNQDVDTDDEAFTVALGSLPNTVTRGTHHTVSVTIVDDEESPPTVSLSVARDAVFEGLPFTVTATLSAALSADVAIPVTLTDGTAEPADHGNLTSITISAGERSGTGTITTNQDVDEADETFTVALGSLPSSVSEGSPNSIELTIVDDDAALPPDVSLSAQPNPVDEGSSVTVTATLTASLRADLVVPLVLATITAETGDYSELESITIPANQTSGTGAISIIQDADNADETFSVTLGNLPPGVVGVGAPSMLTIEIADDDVSPITPTVSLTASPNPVDEGTSVTVTATLSATLTALVGLRIQLTRGSAETGDFGNLTSIAIPAGSLTGTGTITTLDDADNEDETFTVALGSLPSEVRAGSPVSVPITITDLDPPTVPTPTVRLSASPNPVTEGSPVTVTATLSAALPDLLALRIQLTRGSAEAGDYGNLTAITIPPRSLTGTGTITTLADADNEDETFTVALSTPLPAAVTAGTPVSVPITITDNRQGTPNTPSAPDAPTSLSVGAASTSTGITINWQAPTRTGSGPITGYVVYGGTSSAPTTQVGTATSTSFTYTSVSPSTTYYFRVRARNSTGLGAYSSEVSFTTGAPTDPARTVSNLGAFSGPGQITLAWTAPSRTTGLRNYQVQVSATSSAQGFANLAQAGTTTHIHRGLPDNAQRWYRVRAEYSDGNHGAWSNVTTATTPAQPNAPSNLTAQTRAGEVLLGWQAPSTSTRTLSVTGYRIEYSRDGVGASWAPLASVDAGVTQYLHPSVPPRGETWFYRVIALTESGESLPSNSVSVNTPAERPSPPDAISATPLEGAVTVTWTAPVDDGGAPITSYQVEVSTNRVLWSVAAGAVSPALLEYTHADLDPATTYFYRVLARNSVGLSDPSKIAQAKTPATGPGQPRELVAQALSYSEIQLTWKPPESDGGSPIMGYRIERSVDRGSSWVTIREQTGTALAGFHDRDLEPATVYQYRVSAVNALGVGEPSGIAEAATHGPPGQPRALIAMTQSRSEILLIWEAPDTIGTAPVTGYKIQRSTDGGVSWLTIRPSTGMTTTQYLDTELKPGRLYRYRVSAESPAGPSEPSEFAEARTHGPPGIPRDLVANAVSREQINLWWSPPDSDGGVPITGYILEFSGDGGGSWEVLSHLSDERTYAHAGLSAGFLYYYRVRAVNEIGTGLPSEMAQARTLADVPEPPRDLAAHAPAWDRIDLRWRPPAHDGGSEVTGYFIEASTDAGASWFVAAESHSDTRFAHTGLAPSTRYQYRVSAINAVGTSTPSAHTEAVTLADVPAAPPDLVAEAVSHDRIELRWTRPGSDGGSPITGYRIDVSDDGGDSWVPLADNTSMTKTSYSHVGLEHATVYRYRVAAINEAGRGQWSPHAEARTHAVVPGSPRALTATVVAYDQIELAWNPPVSDGGAPVTMIVVEASTDEREWSVLAEVEAPAQLYTHVGAEAGVKWSYRVSAVNEAGRGAASNVASATIDDAGRRSERVSAAILPWFTASATASAVGAISGRVEAVARGAGPDSRVNLAGARNGLRGLADGAGLSRSSGSFSVWAAGDVSGLARTDGAVEYDGEVMSLHAGLDGMMSRSLMIGVAGNRSSGAFEFTDRTNGRDMSGEYDASLTTLTPYMAWVRDDVSVWVAPGVGQGTITIADSAAVRTSNMASTMVALGGIRELGSNSVGSFGLRADGWMANIQVGGNAPEGLAPSGDPQRIDQASYTTRRARLMLDWRVSRQVSDGNDLEAVLRGGARRDWHSTEAGGALGAEIGGEMRLTSQHVRVRGAGRMFVHSGHREWGVRGTFELSSWQERGVTVEASPSFGAAESGIEALWNSGAEWSGGSPSATSAPLVAPPAARLGVSAAYRPGGPLALIGRYDTTQRALTFGTELARTLDWRVESRYSGRGGLAFTLKGSRRF